MNELLGKKNNFETYWTYVEKLFLQPVQRFSQGEKKSTHKFRIVAALCSSVNKVDRHFYLYVNYVV